MKIKTNNVPRPLLYWYELTDTEHKEFDYLDTEESQNETQFFRYRGAVYDLGEFMRTDLPGWDGIATDTYFSATVVRLARDGEFVIVGRVYS